MDDNAARRRILAADAKAMDANADTPFLESEIDGLVFDLYDQTRRPVNRRKAAGNE